MEHIELKTCVFRYAKLPDGPCWGSEQDYDLTVAVSILSVLPGQECAPREFRTKFFSWKVASKYADQPTKALRAILGSIKRMLEEQ